MKRKEQRMSRYEWEHGEFTLPSADFPRVRQSVQAADADHKKRVFAITQAFWSSLSRKERTDSTAYLAAVTRLAQERTATASPRGHVSWAERELRGQQQDQAVRETAIDILHRKGHGARPARVRQADMDFPTNRTTTYQAGECSVSVNAANRTIEWNVPENNHACDHARGTHLGAAFFAAIGKVRWTHGTGGVITGNDEYARDSRDADAAANYVKAAYGYLGIQEAPMHARPFTNAKGQQVTPEVKIGRYGPHGRAVITGPRTPQPAGYRPARTRRSSPRP